MVKLTVLKDIAFQAGKKLKAKDNPDIDALRTGDIKAYEFLFKKYYAPLVVFAGKYVNDLDVAREIVQDLFVRLYEKRQTLSIDISVKSYLYRSVYNSSINHIHQRNIREKHNRTIAQEKEVLDYPDDDMNTVDLQKRIYDIIESLPTKCRKIFKMNRFEGMKNEEIAQVLNLSKRTVETQISKALKILRNQLSGDALKVMVIVAFIIR